MVNGCKVVIAVIWLIVLFVVCIPSGCSGQEEAVSMSEFLSESQQVVSEGKKDGYFGSVIGMWYTVWWDDEGGEWFYQHWGRETRYKPVIGYYSSRDPKVIESHFNWMKKVGIDFLILDDTNGHWNDGGNIAKNIDAIFKVAEGMGSEHAPQIALAIGAGLWVANSIPAHMEEVSLIYERYATSPMYFHWKGRPLLISYTTANWFKWNDNRFTVRRAIGSIMEGWDANPEGGLWGWVFNGQIEGSEVYGVMPGWDRTHLGDPRPGINRYDGQRYIFEWLEAIKTNPEVIIIVSWNDFSEETAIEAAVPATDTTPPWVDCYGNLTPTLYERITEAYLALRNGFLEGYYYKEENGDTIYVFRDNVLTPVSEVGIHKPLIIIPDDYLEWYENNKRF